MAEHRRCSASLPRNKALLTELSAIAHRLGVKVIECAEDGRVGNFFVTFHDPFGEYFGNDGKQVIILNGIPSTKLMT